MVIILAVGLELNGYIHGIWASLASICGYIPDCLSVEVMCGGDWPQCQCEGCLVDRGGDGDCRHGHGGKMVGVMVIFDGGDIVLVIIR